VGAANTDARADAALAEVQADAGEEFDRAVKAEAHGGLSAHSWELYVTPAYLKAGTWHAGDRIAAVSVLTNGDKDGEVIASPFGCVI
jgi:hypothetical protein